MTLRSSVVQVIFGPRSMSVITRPLRVAALLRVRLLSSVASLTVIGIYEGRRMPMTNARTRAFCSARHVFGIGPQCRWLSRSVTGEFKVQAVVPRLPVPGCPHALHHCRHSIFGTTAAAHAAHFIPPSRWLAQLSCGSNAASPGRVFHR